MLFLQLDPSALGALGLGDSVLTRSRTNGFMNMLESMKKKARMATADLPRFPSLVISKGGLEPQGAFAEAQARLWGGQHTSWGAPRNSRGSERVVADVL